MDGGELGLHLIEDCLDGLALAEGSYDLISGGAARVVKVACLAGLNVGVRDGFYLLADALHGG